VYTKIFEKILDSSIWLETDSTLRVWLTMLVSMDEDGFCAFACEANLARRANVKPSLLGKALEILSSPDLQSSDPSNEGRRIERVPGGWMVLNAVKYRKMATREDSKNNTRERVAHHRATQRNSAQLGTPTNVTPLESSSGNGYVTLSEAEAEAEADLRKPTPTPVAKVEIATPAKPKRRSKASILSAYSPQTRASCDGILKDWPAKQPDGSPIRLDTADFMLRIDALLQNPELTPEILIDSARRYLAEKKKFRRAPQYFFGAGNGEGAHWLQYARMAKYEESQEEAYRDFSLSAPGPTVATPMPEIRSGEVRSERGKD
jgi:hypothetical protein